jgi:hypothetical protein
MIRLLTGCCLVAVAVMLAGGCTSSGTVGSSGKADKSADAEKGWTRVFDGQTLAGWKVTDFEDHGAVRVADGQLIFEIGKGDLTGVTWTGGRLPHMDYEISLEAMRLDGEDFFCGLTLPVKDSCLSLIAGGWGGTVVGLSCLDGYDAYNNETTYMKTFENKKWYRFSVRVTAAKVGVWIDGEQVVDGKLTRLEEDNKIVNRQISVRYEVERSQPLGLAAYRTKAAVRNVRYRMLTPAEIAAAGKDPL